MDDFPAWIRAAHWVNVLLLGFLVRSGIQILAAYPRLYADDHCTPGTEWLKLTDQPIPSTGPWTSLEQERSVSSWLAQPGGNNLGLGRHWHFFAAAFWILNGVAYVILLFLGGRWRRLVPTSWSIVPDAWHTVVTYASLSQPPASEFHPFDPLQQLTYFAVVFLLAPLLILTGAAQSPAIAARYPRFQQLFGGRQRARSLHFLGLVGVLLFTAVHVLAVAYTGLGDNLGDIMLGQHETHRLLAFVSAAAVIVAIGSVYALTSAYSLRRPRTVQRTLGRLISPPMRWLSLRASSSQQYAGAQISPYFIVNGAPPSTSDYADLQRDDFLEWRLEIRGLVTNTASLSLADLRAFPASAQITKHHCIQGWSGIAQWTGVPVELILKLCQPLPNARYAVFCSKQLDQAGRPYYETLDLRVLQHPQTLLAYEMNGESLSVPHGAPLRLRVETALGFKMVKWLDSIEFVQDVRAFGEGQGGSREDTMFYERSASI